MGTRLRSAYGRQYDLFETARTALKTNFSKYHRQYDADPAAAYSPVGLTSENRNWFDCVLNAAGNACSGAKRRPTTTASSKITKSAPALPAAHSVSSAAILLEISTGDITGVHRRCQHQVLPRLAVGAMLFKRQIYEIPLTDRSNITTSDYTPFE